MREGERNPRPFSGLERLGMSSLRLEEAFEKVFHVCIRGWRQFFGSQDGRRGRTFLRRRRVRLPLIFLSVFE
jgi:hypothetical protein